MGKTVSVLDFVSLGSSISMRHFARMGSGFSIHDSVAIFSQGCGSPYVSAGNNKMSIAPFAEFGSTLSVREFYKLGSSNSVNERTYFGGGLSTFSECAFGS